MSRCLSERSIDHVVLERNEVANSWRTERWDSLRLLTPNWQCRLPGYAYTGIRSGRLHDDARGGRLHHRYAEEISAPVECGTTVKSVRRTDDGYVVATDQGEWQCTAVVLASGAFNVPKVPAFAAAVPTTVVNVDADGVPQPGSAPRRGRDGGRGSSATGVQIAAEIQRSGRQVVLAVGEHVRGPRMYRGRDIHWWMEVAGVLDERYDEVDDIVRARRVPSMQLAGSDERVYFRSQCACEPRCPTGWPARRHKRRTSPILRILAQQV